MMDTLEKNPPVDETGEVKEPICREVAQTPEQHPEDLTEQVVETDETQQQVSEQPVALEEEEKEVEDVVPDPPETAATDNETPETAEPLLTELPTTPDNYCGELQEAIETGAVGLISKQEILDQLKVLVANAERAPRDRVDQLKLAYYRTTKAESDELKKVFIERGGRELDFLPPRDETSTLFRDLLAEYKRKRAALHAKEEQLKEENYARKLHLIDRLQALVECQDDFNKRYNEFKEIQQTWKELNPVPHDRARELWQKYQVQVERFYDLIKINNQFRDYDFKKNLELKTAVCEAVEKLAHEPDAVSAYYQMQKLFQQWREIGPVARDLREDLWLRFKEASTVIHKKHQAHFELQRMKEEENLITKTALCETVEAIDVKSLKTIKDWEKATQTVVALQKEWHTIGFAPKKSGVKIVDRFRRACNLFFDRKNTFYKSYKKEQERNLILKRELIEKAEALKERTDWKEATKEIIAIQQEWKKIGPVAYKHIEALQKQFSAACSYFFEQKNSNSTSREVDEQANLKTKQLLIEKIRSLDHSLPVNEALMTLKLLIAEWNTVGYVPFNEKDSIYETFRRAVDDQYERLNAPRPTQTHYRTPQYRDTPAEPTERGGYERGKRRSSEREKLMRSYERIKNELQTYENNVGFFNVSSKGGNSLVKEMEHKINRLKDEMSAIVKKIDAIDEKFEA